ncbi:transcription factor subunit Med10 [Colletotrichum graminicola]|uniref:Mediator of RNA polymerase II transcription subunit 10 n=2 Tax=Colletotrichum graminicola species complex TaxID=2707348 RepID=E3QCB8_COLGM|nr:transcription factor subunit Med10 [Colletotrichum graminicola M1.001]XP_060419284.1 transcription factor subunit Med10 [Colletotrichum navitas]EFQ28506.1 transcription factor subunit Med10 [Colletotrichum graminicola M1.001]KAK1598607.1 transcription factor subunit Med10 [Colletotrichum navitas]WDK16024.1 transcription factor subunit Med10 [Colletotrichum graminicola]
MAPLDKPTPEELEQQLKDTIQDLYQIMVQVTTYNATPSNPSGPALAESVQALSQSLQRVHMTAVAGAPPSPDLPGALPKIPPELVQYVENGRNPDIYTREFVELVRRGNQLMRGKMGAFARFRDVLADHIERGMPELRDDVARVLESTKVTGSGRPGTAE